MNREWAINLVKQHMKKPNLIKHVIAVGGCMRKLANYFNENEERWEIAGILHDLDYEYTNEDSQNHPEMGVNILKELGFNDEEILHAILAHNNKVPLETLMDKALYLVVVNHWVIRIERLYSIINQRVTNSCIYRDLENDKVFLTYLLNF
jgi:uncharacterized protein